MDPKFASRGPGGHWWLGVVLICVTDGRREGGRLGWEGAKLIGLAGHLLPPGSMGALEQGSYGVGLSRGQASRLGETPKSDIDHGVGV